MSKRSNKKRGIFELENATDKNSAHDGSGHKVVRLFSLLELIDIRKSKDNV